MHEWTFPLSDGRILGGAEYGDLKGRPVFLFHGQPGNRLFHPDEDISMQQGVRLIVPDRPGYGLSEFQEGRRLLDWPHDVTAIADHLGLAQFDVIGYSGGGPYALACAYAIPHRLRRVCVVSGAPPMHIKELRRQMQPLARLNYGLTHYVGALFGLMFKLYWQQARKEPAAFIELMRKQSPPADQAVFANPELRQRMIAVWQENLRVDSRGYVQDAQILMSNWGFALDAIQVPVELWWGTEDVNVPAAVLDYLAEKLPDAEKKLLLEAGHFGLLTSWEQILKG